MGLVMKVDAGQIDSFWASTCDAGQWRQAQQQLKSSRKFIIDKVKSNI